MGLRALEIKVVFVCDCWVGFPISRLVLSVAEVSCVAERVVACGLVCVGRRALGCNLVFTDFCLTFLVLMACVVFVFIVEAVL